MPEMIDPGVLVNLAAEGIVGVVSGCAKTMSALKDAAARNLGGEAPPPKAINLFGPPIVERWLTMLTSQPKEAQVNIITQLASLPLVESRKAATAAIARLADSASPEDKSMAVEYLTAIPLAVKRSLVQDPDTGKMTLPTVIVTDDAQALIRLLPSDVPPFPIGTELPGTTYQLEEMLGLGGFGAVYKAKNRCEQHQPPRAIKFCLDASMLATLHRERAILDRLMAVDGSQWSERIVRLYGYALDAKPPFLVYEYVPGGDLTSHLQATRQKSGRGFHPTTALGLIRQVAEALAFAHSQGMVHRDLKPANVLVSGSTIKLTDFGIGGVVATHAVRSGNSMGGSMIGQMSAADQARLFRGSGTPLYMSPEQRRGDQPDPRHDLYSLGVMWYQLVCGDVSRELHPGWPDELIEEYETPKEHIEIIQRCVGYFKKRPANAGELLTLLPGSHGQAPVTAAVPATPPPAQPAEVKSEYEKRRRDAEFEKLKLVLADFIEKDAFAKAREAVTAMLEIKPGDPETLEIRSFLDDRLTVAMSEVHVFKEHQGWVRSVAVAPDGKKALSGSDDKSPILWDLDGRRPLRTFVGHTAAVMSVAFSPDGTRALSGAWDGSVRLWEVDTGREIRRFHGKWTQVKCVAFAPSGTRLLLCSDDRMHLLDVETGKEILQLKGHTDLVQSVAFSPDGRRAVSGGDDNTVHLWDLETGQPARSITGHTDSVTCVAFAPNGKWVLSGSSDHTARLWDSLTGKELRRFDGHKNWVNYVAFAPKALRLLTASGGEIVGGKFLDGEDKTVRIWDLQNERELFRFDKHTASVTTAVFAPSGRFILSGSLDKTIRLLLVPG